MANSKKRAIAASHLKGLRKFPRATPYKGKDEVFIRDYPLSALGLVSPKRFWQACLELGLVRGPYFENGQIRTAFERKLLGLCHELSYSEDSKPSVIHSQIQALFKRCANGRNAAFVFAVSKVKPLLTNCHIHMEVCPECGTEKSQWIVVAGRCVKAPSKLLKPST